MDEIAGLDAQGLAERVGEHMKTVSPVPDHWGVELVEIRPGAVTMRMTIREDMANLHRQCHGGVLFTMADTCFGYSSNSYNDRAVAASCDIRFLKPAEIGDVITATAVEIWKKGRSGLYDVTLTNQDGVKRSRSCADILARRAANISSESDYFSRLTVEA